jgi:hypothetical protein
MAAYVVWFPRNRIKVWYLLFFFLFVRSGIVLVPAVFAIGLWFAEQLLYGFLVLEQPLQGGVGYWVHVGGFLFGLVVSLFPLLIGVIFFGSSIKDWAALILGLFLGCLMDPLSIMYITLPVFTPIINALKFDPLWFGIIMMINLELGCITPPFGLNLYVMKGIAPKEVSMMDIFVSVFPFGLMHMAGMVIVMLFPDFFLWLPNKMIK